MKKLLMVAVVAVLAIFGVTSVASATITNRSVNDSVTANGRLAFVGSTITATCTNVVLSGTVTSSSSVAGSGGTVSSCDNADVILSGRWTKVQRLGTPGSGTWTFGTIAAQVTGAGGLLNCYYSGGLSGTWTSDGRNTILTITGNSLAFVRSTGILPCTRTPGVTGTLTLLGVISS